MKNQYYVSLPLNDFVICDDRNNCCLPTEALPTKETISLIQGIARNCPSHLLFLYLFAYYTDSETPCCIELPACLCDSLVEGVESVFVRALLAAEVPVAPSVTLEAISDQDYTHIHRHADWLEQGGLLQQVSIVNPGQTLELQIAPQTKARLLVVGVAQEDDTSGAFSNKSVWEAPSTQLDGRMTNIQVNNHHSCFKLLADTEIVVLPPQTEPGEANHQRLCFQLYPSMLDYPCVSETIVPRRVRQGTALVNPIILQEQRHGRQAMERGRDSADDEPLYGRIFAKTETGSDSRVVLLETSDRVPRGWLGKASYVREDYILSFYEVPTMLILKHSFAMRLKNKRIYFLRINHAIFHYLMCWQLLTNSWYFFSLECSPSSAHSDGAWLGIGQVVC